MSPQLPVPASPARGPRHSRRRRNRLFPPGGSHRLAATEAGLEHAPIGPTARGPAGDGPAGDQPAGEERSGQDADIELEASAPALAPGSVRTAVAANLLVLAPARHASTPSGRRGDAVPAKVELAPLRRPPTRGPATARELAVVFVITLALAVVWWHLAWEFPRGNQIGGAGDADEYSWFFSWMPFALGHGLNPLVSTYVNFPSGINLMWNTSVLLPSFLMAPVTIIWGAAFSYNVVLTLAPALACSFSYLAFRRWTGRLPSLAGCLVVGFSPYVTSQAVGHLAQVLMASAPLFLILFDRLLVVQSATPWREGLALGLLAWASCSPAKRSWPWRPSRPL